MKRQTLGLIATIVAASAVALAQSARGTAETTVSGQTVSVEYGRPSLQGRDMLSKAPVGTVWRTGADTSTTFTTAADLAAGGSTIPAGSYSLFTKRTGDDGWALVFNKQTGQWGTEHDASQDLASVPLTWSQAASGPDQFTIELSGSGASGELRMLWGTHILILPFEAK